MKIENKIFCDYHECLSPADDFCCPHMLPVIAAEYQQKFFELKEKLRWIPVSGDARREGRISTRVLVRDRRERLPHRVGAELPVDARRLAPLLDQTASVLPRNREQELGSPQLRQVRVDGLSHKRNQLHVARLLRLARADHESRVDTAVRRREVAAAKP